MRKKELKKIAIIVVIMILIHAIIPISSYASAPDLPSDEEAFGISLGGIVDGVIGFFTYPLKLFFIIPGTVANLVLTEIASVGSSKIQIVTLEDILFNRLAITDVNVFSTKTATGENVSNVIAEIRDSVAVWYYVLRNFALVVSLASMLYIGIRMVLDGVAEGRAKYKQLLTNWAIGFVLIFVLHYFIILVINCNTMLVKSFTPSEINQDATMGQNAMMKLLELAFSVFFVQSWGACILYSILMVITFIFLVVYIKRMLMVCFLVMIAPLITMTYAMDRVKSNRAQALNQWVKEFCYNVLIQPFHCIVYLVFVESAMNFMYEAIKTKFNFGAAFFAIACVLCIFIGDKIVRTIFGFNKSKSVAQKIFTGSMVTSTISNIKEMKKLAQSEEEETEMPDTMPGGASTEEVANQVKFQDEKQLEINIKDLKDNAKKKNNGGDVGETSKNSGKRKGSLLPLGTSKGLSRKLPPIVKDIGGAYLHTVAGAVGYQTPKRKTFRPQRENKMSKQEQLFLWASEDYQKNMHLSTRDLLMKTEVLSKTSYKDLRDARDINYKNWISRMQKDLARQGAQDPMQVIRAMISENGIEQEKKRELF